MDPEVSCHQKSNNRIIILIAFRSIISSPLLRRELSIENPTIFPSSNRTFPSSCRKWHFRPLYNSKPFERKSTWSTFASTVQVKRDIRRYVSPPIPFSFTVFGLIYEWLEVVYTTAWWWIWKAGERFCMLTIISSHYHDCRMTRSWPWSFTQQQQPRWTSTEYKDFAI